METLTTLERAIRLQKVDLFSDLETDLLALLASVTHQVFVRQGHTLFAEKSPLRALYVVLGGRMEMYRGNQAIFTVSTDETIGNWALFDDQPSVVTARAAEDTWLLRIDREDFFDLLSDHTEITRKLFQALLKRVRTLLTTGLGTDATSPQPPKGSEGE
jgi:CRP-like cAMP-binding protein